MLHYSRESFFLSSLTPSANFFAQIAIDWHNYPDNLEQWAFVQLGGVKAIALMVARFSSVLRQSRSPIGKFYWRCRIPVKIFVSLKVVYC